MAQPKRFTRHSVTWQYTGQDKKHTVEYFAANDPVDADEADRRNEATATAIAEYGGACSTGTARMLAHNQEQAS